MRRSGFVGTQNFIHSLPVLGRVWLGRARLGRARLGRVRLGRRLLQLLAYTFMSIASGLGLAFAAQITVHFLKRVFVI